MVDTSSAENPHDYGLSEEQAQRIATRYRLSPSQFRQQSEQQQHRILTRLRYNGLAQRRAAFSAQFHRGDDGKIAADGFTRAAERVIEMRAMEPSGLRGRVAGMSVGRLPTEPQIVPEHVADLAPDNTGWTSLGPGNIGGRIRSILINPVNPQNIYIGSVGGGIWITDDGGQNWRPADDLMANLAVCSLAMVPGNPTTIYAGTGEGYCPDGTKDDEIQGNGIFKTVDGRAWQQLSTTAVTDDNTNFRWVNGIAVNGDVVLAGTRSGIFRSTNGGKLWSSSLSGAVGNVLFHPSDGNQCIAGMLFGGGIYYSADGGLNWTRASYPVVPGTTLGRAQVCYAAQSPSNVVYASVEVFESGAAGSQIWQSNDGGRTFIKKNSTTNYLGSQGWYDNIIWAGDPSNANFVIVGGLDLYKSMNGGDTIEPISSGLNVPRSAHYDHHVIRADPRYDGVSNKTVYFGTDGGLYVTSDVKTVGTNPDHTDGWRSLNSKLPITQFYSVSGKFTMSGGKTTITSVVGGSQDNGTLRYTPADGANNWLKWYRGDGGYVASDSPDTNNYYGEYVHLQLFRTTNGGSTAEEIYGEYPTSTGWAWKPAPYFIPDVKDGTAPFIAPFVISPSTPSWLIAGGSSLWRTTNALAQNTPTAGPQWEAIKGPVSGATVSAIAIAAAHNTRMLVGYSNGQIYRTTPDGAPNWERADTGIGANRMCTSLIIDKNDSDRLYATFGGFQANNIWTSVNHGSTWSSLGRGLPAAPIYCVTIHPQNPQWLYVGTETGIFASEDGGQTWAPNNEGPTNCLIYQFAWLGNTLCCASHGRGIFAIDLTIRQQASLVLTGDSAGNLTAFNAQAPGGRASSYRIASSQIVAQPLVDGASVYCVYRMPSSPSGLVAKYSTASPLGAPAWQMGLVGAVTATPCLVKATYPGEPDVLYVFTTDGMLWACDAVAGRVLWGAQVMSPAGAVTAYATQAMNQWVYIATDQGLYAVDTQTRAVVLRNTSYVCSASPLLVSNTVIVPAQNGRVYAVQARTGVEKWNYNSGNVASAPAWIQGSVIVGNQLGQLSGLDYQTGALNFSLLVPNQQIQTVAADGNEFYFVASGTNTTLNAYRLNIATRTLSGKWAVVLSGGSARPLQIVGTSLYLTTTNGTLQAFNTGTGASLWQQFLAGVIPSPPALVYA